MGSEAEGYFANPDDRHINDGSVSTGRGDRSHEECYCFEDCDCEECMQCTECGYSTNDCSCWECMLCSVCYEHVEECGCNQHRDDCMNETDAGKMCSEEQPCDTCHEMWLDMNSTYDCAECDHSDLRCDRDCGCYCNCEETRGMDGELPSPAMTMPELMSYQRQSGNYPTYVNHTCGFHVHASLINRRLMSVLMDRHFHDYLKIQAKVWGKNMRCKNEQFWSRLEGENTFCHDYYRGFEQIMATEHYHDDRYTFVNYCFNRHGTVEVRVAPAFKQHKMASLWIKFVYDTINKFLSQMDTSLVSYTNGREFVNPR